MSRRKRSSAAQPKPQRLSWRSYDDRSHRSFPAMPSPRSLHPDADTVIAAVSGNPEARAIVASYACHLPVTIVAEVLQ